jgi:diguanylate cyclase (GGDEF)-like protein
MATQAPRRHKKPPAVGHGSSLRAPAQPAPAASPPPQPSEAAKPSPEQLRADLERLGVALRGRADAVLDSVVQRTVSSGEAVDEAVQASMEQVCRNTTPAVARWIAGEDIAVTVASAQESSTVFGEVAARRAATLQEVVRRHLVWRDVMVYELRAAARELGTHRAALSQAVTMVQLALESSLLRMCECFEDERRRTDDALARRERELAFLATHDPLTELPNRTLMLASLERMLARSSRTGTPVTALFIDLDNFKGINDSLGHKAGDELLQAVAARLKGVVRDSDALGRLGGDEFVVIAEDLEPGTSAELIAGRLLAALAPPFRLGENRKPLTVTASVGVACSSQACAEELLRDADIAMYRAKWDGRNRHAVFEDGMAHRVQDRMQMEMELREALALDQFRLVYQPTLRLSDMRPTGVEALLRWQHPERGEVGPVDFIPMLEETGLIVDVGRWVLREACAQAAAWHAEGHPLGVAVNVSGRQLDTDGLVQDIEDVLADTGLPPRALTIEVTETTLMRSVEETAERLAAIKRLGVRIAIDDFGTGYSSLAHLKRFPVDALKIDRSFIAGLAGNDEGPTLIHTVVQLGKALAMETVAEGIEAPDELALLQQESCDSGQGFLFARPLEAAQALAFFAAWERANAAAGDAR